MKLREVYKLARREYTAYKTRSRATAIVIGVLFGLLIGILFVVQGLEDTVLRYAGVATDGAIYLGSSYDNGADDDLIRERIEKYGGRIVSLSEQQEQQLGGTLPENITVAKFSDLHQANVYYSRMDAHEMGYDVKKYQIEELFSDQIEVYRYFQEKNRTLIKPISLTLVIAASFILAFTMAHSISSNTKSFMLYRSIGASKRQLFSIYFVYLIIICFQAMCFALVLGLFIGVLATGLSGNYFSEQLAKHYPESTGHLIMLIGLNWRCAAVILGMYLAAPVSFLLCLDQFSNQKIIQKLKGD